MASHQVHPLRRGLTGYVTKGAATEELIAALRAVAAGRLYLSSDLQRSSSPPLEPELLNEREREVFQRLARGETPKQIALDLGISDKTVYLDRASLRAKLGVQNDLDLHRLALERGLLRPAGMP